MGSQSKPPVMQEAIDILKEFGIAVTVILFYFAPLRN